MLGAREEQVYGYIILLALFFFVVGERHLLRSWGSKGYIVCRKCVLSLALRTPPAISTSTLFFVSDDAVIPLCCAEVGVAAMQDELFTAQINESKE